MLARLSQALALGEVREQMSDAATILDIYIAEGEKEGHAVAHERAMEAAEDWRLAAELISEYNIALQHV